MLDQRSRPAEFDPVRLCPRQSCIDAILDDGTLILRHGPKDLKLECSSRIAVRRVNALPRHDQRNLVAHHFIDDLRQMLKRPSEPIQFEHKHRTHLATADHVHEAIKPLSR